MGFGIGDIIGMAAGPIIGGLIGGNSANKAADTQAQASSAAIAEQQRQYDLARADAAPWRTAGSNAVNRLSYLMGLGPQNGGGEQYNVGDFKSYMDRVYPAGASNPGANAVDAQTKYDYYMSHLGQEDPAAYEGVGFRKLAPADASNAGDYGSLNRKFTLADFWSDPVTQASYKQGYDLGQQAIDRMAGARGGRNSGATLKALDRFGTDYTGNQAAASQARYVGDQTNTYNRLAGIAGTGQNAMQNTNVLGQQSATNVGNILTAQGNARGAADIAQGNAYSGALSSVSNMFNQNSMLDRILGGSNSAPYQGTLGQWSMNDANSRGSY